jgi:hypothetical protein
MEEQSEILSYEPGDRIVYVDEVGEPHNAIVTCWWKDVDHYRGGGKDGEPGCNLVFVSDDDSKRDPYGRQIERRTSVVHREFQPAPGNYWQRASDFVSKASKVPPPAELEVVKA